MKHREPNVSLHILPASASPLCVVIRRGPSKCWHFMAWDRNTGEVTPGSWFNGLIYTERCDLAPRGDWMVIQAYNGANKPFTWTAVCRPPFVKASIFWPQEKVTEGGGGFFDPRLPILWMNVPPNVTRESNGDHFPYELGFREDNAGAFGGLRERLERDGWRPDRQASNGDRMVKMSPDRRHALVRHGSLTSAEPPRFSLEENGAPAPGVDLGAAAWANWSPSGLLCFARHGALWRHDPARVGQPPRLDFDLASIQPRPSRAPNPLGPSPVHGTTR